MLRGSLVVLDVGDVGMRVVSGGEDYIFNCDRYCFLFWLQPSMPLAAKILL